MNRFGVSLGGGRRSSNPVRLSQIDKDRDGSQESGIPRPSTIVRRDALGRQISLEQGRSNFRSSGVENPAKKQRSSSCERMSRATFSKGPATGKTPMKSTTPARSRSVDRASVNARKSPMVERTAEALKNKRVKDTRPLTDKGFQMEMLQKVNSYLNCFEGLQSLISGNLKPPLSLKTFVEITDLLIKMIGLKAHLISTNNYVEEMPKVAKKLQYPAQSMSKSWLKTANTHHTWPHALGWISFLVELCDFCESSSDIELSMLLEDDEGYLKLLLETVLEAYPKWNNEFMEDEEKILAMCYERLKELCGCRPEDFDEVNVELKENELRLQEARAKCTDVTSAARELLATSNSQHEDLVKLKEFNDKNDKYSEAIEMEIENLKIDSEKLDSHHEELRVEIAALHETIAKQPMSTIERDEIVKVHGRMQSELNEKKKILEDLKKELYSKDLKLSAAQHGTSKTFFEYSNTLRKLKCEYPDPQFDELDLPQLSFLAADYMKQLQAKQPLIEDIVVSTKEQQSKSQNKVESLKGHLLTNENNLASEEGELNKFEVKLKQKEEDVIRGSADAKSRITKYQDELDDVSSEIAEIQSHSTDVEQARVECEEAKRENEEMSQKKKVFCERATEFHKEMHQVFKEDREELDEIIKTYKAEVKKLS